MARKKVKHRRQRQLPEGSHGAFPTGEGGAGKRCHKIGGVQTQSGSCLFILCGSVLIPLLICYLLQAGLQLSHVLQQFLELGRKEMQEAVKSQPC